MRITWIRSIVLAAVVLVAAASTATAATLESGSDCVVAAGDTQKGNWYAFCNVVRIEGTLNGDLITTASKVEIAEEGRVKGNVLAAAQGVSVQGQVDGSVRAAGFTVQVEDGGEIGDDLAAVGFSISVAEDATVGGSFLGAAYQGLIDGKVAGDVWFAGSGLEITGTVDGDVQASVDAPSSGQVPNLDFFFMIQVKPERVISPGLKVADSAAIGGSLDYTSPAPVSVPEDSVAGGTEYNMPEVDEDSAADDEEKPERSAIVGWLIGLVQSFMALLVFGLAFAFLLPHVRSRASSYVTAHTIPSFGWGIGAAAVSFLLLLLVPMISLALLAFIILLKINPLALPVIALGLLIVSIASLGLYLLSWAARIVVADWIGGAILRRVAPGMADNRFVPMVLGLLIFVPLVSIPYIGFVLKLILVFIGVGGLVATSWHSWSRPHADAADEELTA